MLLSFKGLKPFQLSEYIFLVLFAFFVPMSWRIATYAMIGLFVCTILKGIFEEGFKMNELQYRNKFAYFIFIAFWIIYAISFLYSENTAEARVQIGKKLSFLLFPLFFMTSNLSYLTKDRVRTVMYCFVIGILTLFVINLFWAGYDVIFEGAKTSRFYEPDLLGKGTGYIHHTYTSIYSCLGIIFCFYELFNENKIGLKLFNILTVITLILFIALSSSRAGLLCVAIIFIIIWFWLTFVKKETKLGISVGVIIMCIVIICSIVFNKSIKRITETITNLDNIERQDRRIGITIGYKDLLIDKFWFGVGAGDRSEETLNSYLRKKEEIIQKIEPIKTSDNFDHERRKCLDSIDKKSGGNLNNSIFKYAEELAEKYNCDYNSVRENLATYININVAINSDCNAHNQFSDTIIAVGVMGLILLITFFIYPIFLWIKNKNFDIVFFSLLLIAAFNCLFESIFERQMGIMFFVFFYFLLFHGNFCQQTTDNSQQTLSNLK